MQALVGAGIRGGQELQQSPLTKYLLSDGGLWRLLKAASRCVTTMLSLSSCVLCVVKGCGCSLVSEVPA